MSRRRLVPTLFLFVCALALAGVATAARPAKADKHDRALIKQLLRDAALVAEPETDDELIAIAGACTVWDDEDADVPLLESAVFLTAVLRDIDRSEPDLIRRDGRLRALRPHARVFKQWVAVKRREVAQDVRFVQAFDSSRLAVCAYLDAVAVAGRNAEALDAAIAQLLPNADDLAALLAFIDTEEAEEAPRRTANARFAAFLRTSGYNRAQVATLTG